MNKDIIDFPKIKSPFVRKDVNGQYKCINEIAEGYSWVFEDPTVLAVDKLHGTNICCLFNKGVLQSIDNRITRLLSAPSVMTGMRTEGWRVIEGVMRAIEKKWIKDKFDGRIYGELVGPTVNGNLHNLTQHYFVPFDYLKKTCKWNSWSANKYPKTFEAIKVWFDTLTSLFTKRITKKEGVAEGIVFHHPDGKMAKLRRDMF